MNYLEGTPIAQRIKEDLRRDLSARAHPLRLGIVVVGKNPVSEVFIKLKEKFAMDIGVETRRYEFPETISTNELRSAMSDIVHESHNDGVIVQLPLPAHIDTQSILNTVVLEKDVDVLSARAVGNVHVGKSKIVSPVAGAIRELLSAHDINVKGVSAVVIGHGRLVGQPVATWLISEGARVTIISDKTQLDPAATRDADIVVTGIGSPHSITGEYIKEGATIIDAGTSDVGGEVVGDVDPESVSKKACYMTPIKGGVGPLTVALLFQNLVKLSEGRS